MSQTGDDCHFFYSSTCTKGDSCPFRHVEAARSSTIICNFWKQKNCTKKDCPYRHSNIKGKSVPCYWENQPNGCTKADCTFQHFKPRPVQDGQVPSGTIPVVTSPVIEPIVVNPAEDSSDMDSPTKRPPDQSSATNEENVDGQSSGVQQISVIIQQNRANQIHRGKPFGQSNITPWKRSPFQQHMHKQQLMQQRKRQFQQRQQQHLQRQLHQSQQQQQQQQEVEPSTEIQEENEDDESQSDKQQENDVIKPQVDKENVKKTEKPVEKKNLPSHSRSEGKKTLTPVVPVKKIIKLRKDPKKEKPVPEPKKELPKIKKIIKKVVNSSEEDGGTDELGIKSLEQTLRERALRSMGIVEIIVKKDEKKRSDKNDEDQESDDEDNENSESEKQDATSDENEVEEGSEEEKSEEQGEGEEEEVGSEEDEEVGSEEEEEEEGSQEEEEGGGEEDDLQDPEEIEILPAENMDEFIDNDEEQEDEDETKENENDSEVENEQEDTRKAVKKVSSTRLKKEKAVGKKRESKVDKLKKKKADKHETDIGKSVPKRTVLDRLGRKVKQVSGTSDKSERLDAGSRKSGNIIKLRRSSKSREELKLNSKNRIQPEDNEMLFAAVGSTNSGTIRLASRHGDRNISEKGVRKSSSRTTNVKSRLGWNRPSDSTSETSDLSDNEKQIQQKRSVKNRLGWRNKDDIENNDSDRSSPTKDTKRKRSKSRKSRKKDKKDRYIRERDQYDSSDFSDSDSESQLREKARKLKKLIDFDSDTIEDILRAKERKKKSKSKSKRRRREEELSEESDFSQEDQRKATFSKSRERNRMWESERKKEFVDEDDEDSDSVVVIQNKIPSSRHTGITFQVKNDLARRRVDQFTVDNENSDSDDNSISKTKEFQEKVSLKRGWVKSAVNEAEAQVLTSDVAKKPKINRIEWGTDDKVGSEVVRSQDDVKTIVRPSIAGRTNTSWSTRGSNNIRLVAGNDLKSKMDHLDQIGEEKVKNVQIKSLEEIRREKAQKYVSDDSSSEELDPMEALRQKFNIKSSSESSRQKNIDAKRKNRQAQQIYVPPARKRTVQLAFDSVDDVGGKKERVSSPVQGQSENQNRVSPVQYDMFDNKAQGTSKAEVKTFAEIMAEKRARAKQLRDQSSKAESQTQPCDNKSSKSFKPIVFDIDTGSGSKSVSPTNRFVGTDRESPGIATTTENTENVIKDDDDKKTHKSHKHHHKAKKEKRRWRKKKSKVSPDEDETSQDTQLENSVSNMSTEPSSSTISTPHNNSLRPQTDFSNFAVEISSASKPEPLPVPEPVDIDEPEVTESVPQESSSKRDIKPSESDSWLDFDFGEDLDVSKDDNKDDDDLLREIDELLA